YAGTVRLEEDEVGLGRLHRDAVDLRQPACQRPRIGVVVGKAVDMMIERVDAGGGTDAGLPHRAAEPLLPAPDVVDERSGAGDDAADRRAEALGEVDPGRIPARRHVARRDAGGDGRVQQPRAVHVGHEPMGLGDANDLIQRGLLPDRAAADIGGLLDADQHLRRLVTGTRMQRGPEGVRRELAIVARKLGDLEAAERGMRAALAR
ncbi:hypothetical protein chiPu_0031960, partial [Chiloscyllium punctatum]|nr:hypothetical protein [Chiloscyllium punctatum]